MYGPLSTHEHPEGLGHNSLGLLGSVSPEVHSSTSVAMSHSHSLPTFGLQVSGTPQPSYGARRGSVSSAASSSCSSLEQASDYSNNAGSYSPRSFTPSESPMNLPGSLSSLSGLALGTPDTPGLAELPSNTDHAVFHPHQHNALLAMSHGQDDFSMEMPPPSNHVRRRAAQSFDVAMLSGHQHQMDSHFFAHSQRINESDGSEETTPMPTYTGTFAGQSVANLSDGFRASASQMPVTPQSGFQRASLGAGPCTFTPGQSYSPGSTPDYSVRGDVSNPSSPFYPPSAIALRRLTSADNVRSDSYAPHELGTPSKETPPMLSLSDLKQEPSFQPNLAFRDHFASPPNFGAPHRSSLPDVTGAGMSSAAMARVASAPMSSPMPQLSRSSTSSEASSFASFPSTPSSSVVDGRSRASFMQPSTPSSDFMSPGIDPYYSAPPMSGHRSNSMISLGSPLQGHHDNFTSMLDGRSRSVSGSVTRNTPRGRARNSGPPPLIVSSADKLHVCHCGKRFKRMEHLKRHNRTHTQERPHKCPVETCGKFFGRSDNLAQHLKTHFRPAGLVGRSSELLSLTSGADKFKNNEPRHDPYAAAAAAAAAAAHAAVSVSSGKRGSISQSCLGAPVALNKPIAPRQALVPTGGLSANSSPDMMGMSAHFA